ncbi:MAG: RluA family pseudouridine synthase [Filifactoraceae bacterium]
MLDIIYEDNHVIVVLKPFNVPTQEDSSGDLDLLSMVKEYIRVKYNKPGEAYIGLVHRLDRVAGGVMVFARTSKAASRLSKQIRDREFAKEYLTVVEGKMSSESGTMKDYLLKNSSTNTVTVVSKGKNDSKEAILKYELQEHRDYISLCKIELLTGRPHQIRVQFSSRKHPIYGDGKYGSSIISRKGIALWSKLIEFEHPTTKEKMRFEASPPNIEPWNKFKTLNIVN